MIDMSCPRCGAGGRVPREKMNARMVCKKCLQVFHLTPSGQAVIGEPPQPKHVPKSASKERVPRERIEFDISGLEGLGKKLSRVRLPDPKILGVIAVVLALVGFCAWIFSRQSVKTRTEILATAIAKGDIGTIMEMSLPETVGQAMSWGNDIYSHYADLKISMGGRDPRLQIQVQDNTSGNSAQALVVFSRESPVRDERLRTPDLGAPAPSRSGKDSIEIVLFWAPDTWGTWRLDAKRTAENTGRSL
jgi:hypothetical protein